MNPQFHSSTGLNVMNSFLTQSNFRPIPPNVLFLHQYRLTPYDLMAFRAQALKSVQMPDNLIDQNFNDVKAEFPVKFESKCEYVPQPLKLEASDQDLTCNGSESAKSSYLDQPPKQIDLKPEIEKMIRFLLSNMGKDKEALIGSTRSYYLQNPCLLEVYDKLSMKYYSARKCKEDIIRYILRKVFRHLRMSIMRNEKVSSKKASLLLCKRYFKSDAEPSEEEIEDEEKFLESLMPYNKNSKNKTMNINFVLEIFSSAAFCKEYQDFLPELNTIVIEENKKKEKKLAGFILDCIQKKNLEKLGTVHRLPWLDVWTEDAKNLAIAIMPNKRLIYNSKKPKS